MFFSACLYSERVEAYRLAKKRVFARHFNFYGPFPESNKWMELRSIWHGSEIGECMRNMFFVSIMKWTLIKSANCLMNGTGLGHVLSAIFDHAWVQLTTKEAMLNLSTALSRFQLRSVYQSQYGTLYELIFYLCVHLRFFFLERF